MNKQPEITDTTRNIFIQVFCEFYETRPIEKITVKEITERAGYSRATFYNYFKDTYDLMQYIEDNFINHVLSSINKNINCDNYFDNFILSFTNAVTSKETYGFILFKNPYNAQFINRFKKKVLPVLCRIFNISTDNKSALYALEFYTLGVISIFSRWTENENELTLEELAILIKRILEDGILSLLQE